MGDELDSLTTDYPRNYKAKRQRERKRLGEEEIIGPLGSGVVGGGVDTSSREQLQVQSHDGGGERGTACGSCRGKPQASAPRGEGTTVRERCPAVWGIFYCQYAYNKLSRVVNDTINASSLHRILELY